MHDFAEIDTGFDAQQAILEARRCLYCPDAPCMVLGCPLHNRIPEWIRLTARGDFREAARVSRATSNLPEVCGKLCPQERLCEGRCVLIEAGEAPVAIGRIEEFLGRLSRRMRWLPPIRRARPTGRRVAIVGAGPAGLAAAEELVRRGHGVVVFDRLPRPGGVMVYGIPNFKCTHERLEPLLARLGEAGVEFRCRQALGRDFTLDELLGPRGFDAVLLAIGASAGRRSRLPGEDLANVLLATDFLVRANLPRADWPDPAAPALAVGRTCVVIGGGDTAMDCVRSAVRLGFARTVCLYRRTEAEMPGNRVDRGHAREEGVEFHFLAAPLRFEGRGRLERIVCQRVRLGAPDQSGRRRPEPEPGGEFTLEADTAVLALGYDVEDAGLVSSDGRRIAVGADMATARPGVFAAGDAVNGADLIVTAVRDGRRAAAGIDDYLCGLDNAGAGGR